MIDWLIDFNDISTHLGFFYTKRLGNCIHIYIFLGLKGFFAQSYYI